MLRAPLRDVMVGGSVWVGWERYPEVALEGQRHLKWGWGWEAFQAEGPALAKIGIQRAPGWLSWLSVRLWLRGHDLEVCEFEPLVKLCADSSEPGVCFVFCVSPSLCPSPALALSLSQK